MNDLTLMVGPITSLFYNTATDRYIDDYSACRSGFTLKNTEDRAEIGRKLAIVAGLSEHGGLPEIGRRFIVRKAAIEKHMYKHMLPTVITITRTETEMGRKLALVAGIL